MLGWHPLFRGLQTARYKYVGWNKAPSWHPPLMLTGSTPWGRRRGRSWGPPGGTWGWGTPPSSSPGAFRNDPRGGGGRETTGGRVAAQGEQKSEIPPKKKLLHSQNHHWEPRRRCTCAPWGFFVCRGLSERAVGGGSSPGRAEKVRGRRCPLGEVVLRHSCTVIFTIERGVTLFDH